MLPFDQFLDVCGLTCPLPLLRAKKCLNDMKEAEILYITATDPHSLVDFKAFVNQTGHIIQECYEDAKIFHVFIQKRRPSPGKEAKRV